MAKKVCVIGGSGFIGIPLVESLKQSGRQVIIIGRSQKSRTLLPSDVQYLCGDIKNENFVNQFLYDVDEVLYLAYSTTPRTSSDNLLFDLNDNLINAVTFFSIATRFPIKKLIYISSGGAVYGDSEEFPILENHPTNPISPYGITKLTIEKYAQLLWKTKKLPIICLRPSNIYGEGQEPYKGQGFVSTAIASILQSREIVIYGEYGTIRDYLYIKDFVTALIISLDLGEPGEIYNIGSGIGNTNISIINKLKNNQLLKDKSFKVVHEPDRVFDVNYNVLDSRKFYDLSHWVPTVDLEDGIQKIAQVFLNKYSSTNK